MMWLLQIPGELVMGADAPAQGSVEVLWRTLPLNRWAVVAAAVIFLGNLLNYYHIYPEMAKCAYMWRRNISLENNIQLVRSRNLSCWASVLPAVLIASYYSLAGGQFVEQCPSQLRTLAVLGLGVAWVLLRQMLYLILGFRARGRQCWQAAHRSDYNFFVLLVSLLLVTEAVVLVGGTAAESARPAFLAVTGVVYLLFFVRKYQILSSEYSHFTTFLYLCGLELLPTGILIWLSL